MLIPPQNIIENCTRIGHTKTCINPQKERGNIAIFVNKKDFKKVIKLTKCKDECQVIYIKKVEKSFKNSTGSTNIFNNLYRKLDYSKAFVYIWTGKMSPLS